MVVRFGLSLLVGAIVFFILVPTSGADARCFSLLAFQVPCEGMVAAGAGVTAAVMTAVALWLGRRWSAG